MCRARTSLESLCERSWGKRRGLRSVLDGYADIEVIGEASNGEEAVAMTERLRPSLVLMEPLAFEPGSFEKRWTKPVLLSSEPRP